MHSMWCIIYLIRVKIIDKYTVKTYTYFICPTILAQDTSQSSKYSSYCNGIPSRINELNWIVIIMAIVRNYKKFAEKNSALPV